MVLVARDGRTVFHEAYGLADREAKVPNRKDTKFNLGSINKNFTRVAVHQLARQGKLSLDDTDQAVPARLSQRPGRGEGDRPPAAEHDLGHRRFLRRPLRRDAQGEDPVAQGLPAALRRPAARVRAGHVEQVLERRLRRPGPDHREGSRRRLLQVRPGEHLQARAACSTRTPSPATPDTPNLAMGYTTEGRAGRRARPQPRHAARPGLVGRRRLLDGRGHAEVRPGPQGQEALPARRRGRPGHRRRGARDQLDSVEWDPRAGTIVIVLTNLDPPAAGTVSRQIVSWLPQ
ncbi:MAG: beta-lactamase family protein [Candidatus Moduliflexus flocculans]|nr:beta-lactamase family protein [Candidatus Moduliflexus flocculans]